MAFTCNLDSRGKMVRLIMGSVFLVDGLILALLWGLRTGSRAGWITSIILILSGAFMIFEGRTGWCIVRAMGIKTKV